MARDPDGLLSEKNYDKDATIAQSDSEPESGDEGHDMRHDEHVVRERDREVLDEAEEQERLLRPAGRIERAKGVFGLRGGSSSGGGGRRKSAARHSHGKGPKEEFELMYEMEGGFKDTSSQASQDSFENDTTTNWSSKQPSTKRRSGLAVIYVAIIVLFIALAYGALRASKTHVLAPTYHHLTRYSNGTHTFRSTTILISLDGFRADFLTRNITPALSAFIASGVSPQYMMPSFPSVTFSNHFSLVTGLYPESHGIVGNQFWDPEFEEEFYYTNISSSMQPKWWTAEPLWVTAENQGVRTAIHMWPGSEAHIPTHEPTYIDKYNGTEALTRKVDRILGWLDLPGDDDSSEAAGEKRPQLIAAYVPNVDTDGHRYGPNSTEIRATIADVDSMLTMLVEGLYTRNLTEIVNLVVVSDHGMATTSTQRLIQLDDLIDISLVDHIDGWPLRGLRLKNPERDVPVLYDILSKESQKTDAFDVYTLDTMPERYHFSRNPRIAPLWVIPKTGWAVVERTDFDVAAALDAGLDYAPMGLHGYDHEHPLMRAIFVARGPAFPHEPNSRLAAFQNIEVYNIICDSLGVVPHPNNGTLRLPLQTVGLHSDANTPLLDVPADPISEETPEASASDPASDEASDKNDDNASPSPDEAGGPPAEDDGKAKSKTGWWDFLHDQLEKAKQWAKEFVESIKGNHEKTNSDGETAGNGTG